MLWAMSDAIFGAYPNQDYTIYTSIFYRIVIAKLVCTITLHFMLYIHVARSLSIMKYMINHQDKFTDFFIPFMCTITAVLISIVSEILNVYMLAY